MRKIPLPLLVLGTLVVGACASGGSGAGPTTSRETVSIRSTDGSTQQDVRLVRDNYVARGEVAGTLEGVWDVLPEAFSTVGLPAPQTDRRIWTAMVADHVVRRRLGEQRLSRLLECGRGMTQPHADTHRIHLTVTMELADGQDPESTTVSTRVQAVAVNPEGTTARVTCSSTGELERLLTNAVQLHALDP